MLMALHQSVPRLRKSSRSIPLMVAKRNGAGGKRLQKLISERSQATISVLLRLSHGVSLLILRLILLTWNLELVCSIHRMTTPYVEDYVGHVSRQVPSTKPRTNSQGNPVDSFDEM